MKCKCGCGSTQVGIAGWVSGHNSRTPEHRAKASARMSEFRRQRTGEKNHRWTGDQVGYMALHKWITKHKPRKRICEHCGHEGRTDLANISGEYRRDVNDFIELCRSCHRVFDEGGR